MRRSALLMVVWWTLVMSFAPAHGTGTGVRRVYRIASIKPSDDWSTFRDMLEDYRTNMPNAEIESSPKPFSAEDCNKDANCDVVTIDQQQSTYYTFKIKNGTQAHRTQFGCWNCSPNTPVAQCPSGAKADFVGFMIQHDKCHQDPSSCRERPCSP